MTVVVVVLEILRFLTLPHSLSFSPQEVVQPLFFLFLLFTLQLLCPEVGVRGVERGKREASARVCTGEGGGVRTVTAAVPYGERDVNTHTGPFC
jgi:hypothetical protein